jgi:homoserine kinase type II
MAAFTRLDRAQAERLVEGFDLGNLSKFHAIPEGSVNSNHRVETDRGAFFLRIYEEQGPLGARTDADLAAALATRGVPTPSPLRDRDGRTITLVGEKPAAVFPWIDGAIVCQARVTTAHAHAVGAALAKLHVAGAGVPVGEGRFRVEDVRRRLFRITDPHFREATRELMGALDRWTAERLPDLPRGLIHGDLFRDNVLWKDDTIAALLDFESASEGALGYDLAVTLLAWCFGDDFDRDLVSAMRAGYESVRPLEPSEREGLLAEACIAAIRFTTTRITDYAMKPGESRVMKDWRRFQSRLRALEANGL